MEKENFTKEEVRKYILEASLTEEDSVNNDTLIFEVGLLDSMGLLFLIEFLNEKFEIEVADDELDPKNFESINSIVSFISSKQKVNV